MYWINHGSIARANLNGTDVDSAFIPNVGAYQLAVDGSHIFWLGSSGELGRANVNGSDVERRFLALRSRTLRASPSYLALAGGYVYWAYRQSPTVINAPPIGRVAASGGAADFTFIRPHVPDCVNSTLPPPEGEQCTINGLTANGQYVFWSWSRLLTSVGPLGSGIGRANVNGSGTVDGLMPASGRLGGLGATALAANTGHLFWTSGYGIGRANLDGSDGDPTFISDPEVSGLGVSVSSGPQAESTVPMDGAQTAPSKAPQVVVFSVAMRGSPPPHGAVQLRDDTLGRTVPERSSWFAGRALILTPAPAGLAAGHRFTVTIAPGLRAADGTPTGGAVIWSFRVRGGPGRT